jgi:hypothetical protein
VNLFAQPPFRADAPREHARLGATASSLIVIHSTELHQTPAIAPTEAVTARVAVGAKRDATGDRSNAVLAAVGYNFSLLLRWLARLLRALIRGPLSGTVARPGRLKKPLNRSSRPTKQEYR